MTYYIAGNTAVENTRNLAQSALPNAPQEPDHEPDRRHTLVSRAQLGKALRAMARHHLELADRFDPSEPAASRTS